MHRRRISASSSENIHGDRPWVFFMIDCFFLITQFFLVIFQFKVNEPCLAQSLPQGPHPGKNAVVPTNERLSVHVTRGPNGAAAYVFLGQPHTLTDLKRALSNAVGGNGAKFGLRVSYDADLPFGYVMDVYNECARFGIKEVGMVPLRGAQARQ